MLAGVSIVSDETMRQGHRRLVDVVESVTNSADLVELE